MPEIMPKQVGADGTISAPSCPKPLLVAGLTDGLIEALIATTLKDENIIRSANVSVRRLRVSGTGGPPPGPIAPFDLVRVSVDDLEGPGATTVRINRVPADGTITLPYAGPLKIESLTDQQVEAAIAKAYRDNGIVEHPTVSVLRLEAAPPDAARLDLPDAPIFQTPDSLAWLYATRAENRTASLRSK